MLQKLFHLPNRISALALLVVMIFSIGYFSKIKAWAGRDVFMWDVSSYYWFLPAIFIHHDPALHFTDGKEGEYNAHHKYFAERTPEGNKVNRYTMGTAIMYSPFFFATLAYDKIRGAEINEFSTDYEFMISLAALVYVMLALLLLRNVLLRFFSDTVVALAIIILPMATNLLFYYTVEGGMTHSYSFFLFSALVWLTVHWYESKKTKHAILLGIVLGLIFLVRPTNIIAGLFFVLYDIHSIADLTARLKLFFVVHWKSTLIISLSLLLAVSPQFIYWKYVSGHWFFYGYGRERFFFNNPHILEGFLSYRKGWLVYTPIMIFSIIGMLMLRKKHAFAIAVPVFFLINSYIVFSWWSWWYAGGFGQRALIESYPLMILPFCVFMQWLFDKKNKVIIASYLVVVAFAVHVNLVQTRQYRVCFIHWDSMTKEAYWAVFLKNGVPPDYDKMLKAPDNEKALNGEDEYEFSPFN